MTYTAGTAAATPVKLLHGNNGTFCVTIPSGTKQLFTVTKLAFKYSVALERIDNSSVPGWAQNIKGQQMISGTFSFVFDLANSPFVSPQSLLTSDNTYELNLNAVSTANVITTLNTQLWTGPAMVSDLDFTGIDPNSPQTVTATFISDGAWTIPAV